MSEVTAEYKGVPRPDVVLVLPHSTALVLLELVGNISGAEPIRAYTDPIYDALHSLLGKTESPVRVLDVVVELS